MASGEQQPPAEIHEQYGSDERAEHAETADDGAAVDGKADEQPKDKKSTVYVRGALNELNRINAASDGGSDGERERPGKTASQGRSQASSDAVPRRRLVKYLGYLGVHMQGASSSIPSRAPTASKPAVVRMLDLGKGVPSTARCIDGVPQVSVDEGDITPAYDFPKLLNDKFGNVKLETKTDWPQLCVAFTAASSGSTQKVTTFCIGDVCTHAEEDIMRDLHAGDLGNITARLVIVGLALVRPPSVARDRASYVALVRPIFRDDEDGGWQVTSFAAGDIYVAWCRPFQLTVDMVATASLHSTSSATLADAISDIASVFQLPESRTNQLKNGTSKAEQGYRVITVHPPGADDDDVSEGDDHVDYQLEDEEEAEEEEGRDGGGGAGADNGSEEHSSPLPKLAKRASKARPAPSERNLRRRQLDYQGGRAPSSGVAKSAPPPEHVMPSAPPAEWLAPINRVVEAAQGAIKELKAWVGFPKEAGKKKKQQPPSVIAQIADLNAKVKSLAEPAPAPRAKAAAAAPEKAEIAKMRDEIAALTARVDSLEKQRVPSTPVASAAPSSTGLGMEFRQPTPPMPAGPLTLWRRESYAGNQVMEIQPAYREQAPRATRPAVLDEARRLDYDSEPYGELGLIMYDMPYDQGRLSQPSFGRQPAKTSYPASMHDTHGEGSADPYGQRQGRGMQQYIRAEGSETFPRYSEGAHGYAAPPLSL
eukprot:jgi/Mesvir1/18175/Mv26544-RA.1